ncbi:MAG TPA: permease-like cell division protein FtsX [Candidatus Paceibacterota bacterium]
MNLRRVTGQGLIMFWRNGLVSFTAVFVSTVTLFTLGAVIIGNAFLSTSLAELKDKVDVNVYFLTTASSVDILNLKKRIEGLPEVKSVEYIDRDEALRRFVERNKGNALLLQSLDELGDNPLGAVLNVRAKEPSQYAQIADFLNRGTKSTLDQGEHSIIDKVNYADNEYNINRLISFINSTHKLGFTIGLILVLMVALVTASTIRLAIYNSRQEIGVMRLVGAANSFIRGPFIISGVLYGSVSAILAGILLYPGTYWTTKITSGLFGGIDLVSYYLSNIGQIFMILLFFGILLGMCSSFLAVRRYLNI